MFCVVFLQLSDFGFSVVWHAACVLLLDSNYFLKNSALLFLGFYIAQSTILVSKSLLKFEFRDLQSQSEKTNFIM